MKLKILRSTDVILNFQFQKELSMFGILMTEKCTFQIHVDSNGVTSSKINKTKITSQNIKSGIIPSTTRFQIMPPALNILILTRDLWKTLYTSKTIKAHLNSEKKSIESIIFIPIICWQKKQKKNA